MSNVLIKFSGVPDVLLSSDIVEVVVDTNVFLPGMFTILISDTIDVALGTLKHGDNALKFSLGTSVDIVIEEEKPDSVVPMINTLISGEITGVEPVFRDDGQVFLKIRGYDRSHRLTYGKNTRTFGDGNPYAKTVTDQQIFSSIAMDVGLLPQADFPTVKYNYVMQYNQSDWDFLWSRAELLGYQIYADGKTLHFKKSSKTRYLKGPNELIWGRNLSNFDPRLVSMGTVSKVEAFGWDPDSKKKISGKTGAKISNDFVKTAESTAGSKIPLARMKISQDEAILDPVMRSSDEAKTAAQARGESRESQFVRASGEVVDGDPFLLAGTEVVISNVGARFSGKYYVTEAKHIWRQGDYRVQFQVSGRNPYTIRSMLLGHDQSPNKINGVVIGIVTDLGDPQKLGRVKVKYPWMPEYKMSELESSWARIAVAGGGKDRGIFFLPEVDDEVLVSFERGDVNYPYIVGVLWNSKDKPPAGKVLAPGNSKVNERIVRSRSGHMIIFDDTENAEQIIIKDKTEKNSIVIDSKSNSMTLKTQGDFTVEAGGKFIVKSKQDMSLESMGKGTLTSTSNLQLESKAGANLKAGTSEVDLQMAGASLKGTKVDVQANAAASLKGNAMVEIQGGLVKIN